jgi:acyl-CoA thioester hydrolase
MDSFLDHHVRVRYAETDQMGIVYHSNYLIWMEVGRVEYCRAKGILYRDMEAQEGILLVVAEANCRYSSPALFDEEVLIRTRIGDATPRMVRFEYEMRSGGDARLLASGFTKHVFCNRERKATKLPEMYRAAFGIGELGSQYAMKRG